MKLVGPTSSDLSRATIKKMQLQLRMQLKAAYKNASKYPIKKEMFRTQFFENAETILGEGSTKQLARFVLQRVDHQQKRAATEFLRAVSAVRAKTCNRSDILTVCSSDRLNTSQDPKIQTSIHNCEIRRCSSCTFSLVTPFGRVQIDQTHFFEKGEPKIQTEEDARVKVKLATLRATIESTLGGDSLEIKLPTLSTIQWAAMLYLLNGGECR